MRPAFENVRRERIEWAAGEIGDDLAFAGADAEHIGIGLPVRQREFEQARITLAGEMRRARSRRRAAGSKERT